MTLTVINASFISLIPLVVQPVGLASLVEAGQATAITQIFQWREIIWLVMQSSQQSKNLSSAATRRGN
tara:strand:- start:317 stop:520 length:204 start_codon:yes stop_codon:yes gene_type:complete